METGQRMMILNQIHRGLAWLTMAGLALQFYLAGLGMFGATSFEMHRGIGYLLALLILLLMIVALIGRYPRRALLLSAALIVLTVVQVMLPSLRTTIPFIAALHPVNAMAMLGVTAAINRARPRPASEQVRQREAATA
jgi:hypothetical protein